MPGKGISGMIGEYHLKAWIGKDRQDSYSKNNLSLRLSCLATMAYVLTLMTDTLYYLGEVIFSLKVPRCRPLSS